MDMADQAKDNFATIANAVEEGRTIYDNIKKAILFLLTTNSGQALVVILSIGFGLGVMDEAGHFMLPISPPQILWINMVTAVTLALSTAFEPPEANIMRRPPRDPEESLVTGFMLWRIIIVGILLVTGTLGHYTMMLQAGASSELASTAAINALVVGQIFYLINNRFVLEPSWTLKGFFGSRAVLVSIGVLVILQGGFTYFPPMQYLFDTVALPLSVWGTIFAYGISLFALIEIEKAILLKRQK
jgi:magnesium-transporting ATPase (P-type)